MAQRSALNALPPGYTFTERLEISSRKIFVLLNLVGLIPLFLGAIFFFGVDRLFAALRIMPLLSLPFDDTTRVLIAVLTAVLVVPLLSFHELCHGVAFQVFGAHPRYGVNFRKAVAYARADQYFLHRNGYIVVALTPLVVISILVFILMALTGGGLRFVVALMGAANAGGAVGDLWFTAVCLRYPNSLLVRDFGEGAELFMPPPSKEDLPPAGTSS